MIYECAPSCRFTFDNVAEYLRHMAACPRVLPGVADKARSMQTLPAEPTKRAKRRPVNQDLFPQ